MESVICKEARRASYLLNSSTLYPFDKEQLYDMIYARWNKVDISSSLQWLTSLLEKHYGQKAILLIDEYDVPLDKAYQHGYYDEMINLIRAMFGSALKTNDSLYFAVLTGCLRVSKESIFTGLNNLKVHSISDAQFDEYFGFTDADVEQIMSHYGLTAHRAEMKKLYGNYHFGKQNVYWPWDVINYCYDLRANKNKKPQAYWINTSGNDMTRHLIDKVDDGTSQIEIERLIEGQSIRKTLSDKLTHNEIYTDSNNLWSVLFMTG